VAAEKCIHGLITGTISPTDGETGRQVKAVPAGGAEFERATETISDPD
jgi:hypothetical protein